MNKVRVAVAGSNSGEVSEPTTTKSPVNITEADTVTKIGRYLRRVGWVIDVAKTDPRAEREEEAMRPFIPDAYYQDRAELPLFGIRSPNSDLADVPLGRYQVPAIDGLPGLEETQPPPSAGTHR